MKRIFNQKATLSLMIMMILMALILGVMLLMNNNEKFTESYLYSTTASISILDIGYDNGSNIINPATISASLYYDNVDRKHIVTTTLNKGVTGSYTTGTCGADNDGEYGANMPFTTTNRGLRISISSLASGTRIAFVGGGYGSLNYNLFERTYTVLNNKNSFNETIEFNVGSNKEKGTLIIIGVSFHFRYKLYDINNNSHEIWLDVSNDTVSGYSYDNYKRIGYKLEGFYTQANGQGRKVFSVDDNNNISTYSSPYIPDSNLYPYYTPKDYRVDINVLNPNGTQDYKSGTFTQYYSYTDSTSNNLTDQAYSTIKQGSYTEIRNIVPVAGYYLYNVTATVGTIENRGNGVYRYTASFSSEPKGSSSWDAVINVQMRYINYSVIFNANGGDGGSMSNQSFVYNTAQALTRNSFTRKGYTFKGWNTKADGSGTSYKDGASANNLTTTHNGIVTLYAQWTQNQISATLYQNYYPGDTTTIGSPISNGYSSSGTTLNLPSPSRTGYEFKGWSLTSNGTGVYNNTTDWNNISINGKKVSDSNAGVIEFKLYAIWEANDYKISYVLNDGSPGSSHPTTATYDVEINISNPTKEGYTFTGWTASGLSNTAQAGGASWNGTATTATAFKNLTAKDAEDGGTVTLTANWEAITYTIAFNGNGSTGGSTSSKKATYDSYVTLTENGFIKAGYVFTGWNTKSGGTGESYSDKETVKNLTSTQGATVTLYAQWQKTIASDIESTYSTAGTYYINTAADLAKLIYTTEKDPVGNNYTFIQTANIDLSGSTYLPIGRLNSFSATYDGQGYTISGLRTYNGTDANGNYLEVNGGLFANASGATIKNLIIEGANIYGQNAGIIAGSGNKKTNITNCVVSGSVNGSTVGSIIGNGNGASISACLAKGVNTASFAGGSASVDSCIYELTGGTKGASDSFDNYSAWIYPSNFAYPMPKAFMWYPYPELTKESLNTWLGK